MPVFGRFEAERDLASSGPFTVWSARPTGEAGAARFAVKSFRTQDDFGEPELIERRAKVFLAGAEVQRALAKSAPTRFAPVHDLGKSPEFAYYITDLYTASVQNLVDTRRELSARLMAEIVGGVAEALEAIAAARGGRGHGNLKPGNVLVMGDAQGELEGGKVHLIDPLPDDRVEASARTDDYRELAGLLHLMVTQRPSPKGGTVERGPEWSRMGGAGELLRQLCELLLNPQPGAALMTVAEIRQKLAGALAAKTPGKGPNKALIAAAAVLLIGAGVGAFLYLNSPGPKKIREGEDPRLVVEGQGPAAWMADEIGRAQGFLADVERAVSAGAGTEEQLNAFGKFRTELAERIGAVEKLRTEAWPVGKTEEIVAQQKEMAARFSSAEQELKATGVAISELKRQLPDVTPGQDPRGANAAEWMAAREKQLKDACDAAIAELKDSGEPGAADLAKIEPRYGALLAEIVAVRALVWEPPAAEGQDPAAAIAAKRRAQEDVTARVPKVAGEARDLTQEARQAVSRSRERLGAWFDERQENPPETIRSGDLRSAYKQAVRRLSRREDIKWSEARVEVEKFGAFAARLEAEMPTWPVMSEHAGSMVKPMVAQQYFEEQRAAALVEAGNVLADDGKVPDAGDQAYTTKLEGLKTGLAGLAADAAAMLESAKKVEGMLVLGYGYTDAGADGASIKSVRQGIEGSARYGVLKGAVQDVVERAAALETLGTVNDTAALVEAVGAAARAGDVSGVITAWRRLRDLKYPPTEAGLEPLAEAYRQSVRPTLDKTPDAARKTTLTREGEAILKQLWTAFVHERTGGRPEAVGAAFGAMSAMGITPEDIAKLEPFARFNYERWRLLSEIEPARRGDPKDEAAALKPVVEGFWARAGSAASGALTLGPAGELRARMRPFEEGKVTDLEKDVGPARAAWAGRVLDAEGSRVSYSWTGPSGRAHTLEFIRVSETPESSSYVCTTEMSLGLFADLIESGQRWGELETMRPGSPDTREGPIVWEWSKGGPMAPAKPQGGAPEARLDAKGNGWLTYTVGEVSRPTAGYYPAGVEVPKPPSLDSPLNYVGPSAAVTAAALTGCRLPTSDEWKKARERDPSAGADSNRRDTAWAAQFAHVRRLQEIVEGGGRSFGQLRLPNGNILRVEPRAEKVAPDQDTEPAVQGNDGWLWFRPVQDGGGSVFHHLEGNVSEYVFETPTTLDGLLGVAAQAAKPTEEAVRLALGKGESLKVMGASALSPKEYAPADPLPCVPRSAERGFTLLTARPGFSDVGFRLAFSTGAGGGSGKPVDRLAKLLRESAYLTRDSK